MECKEGVLCEKWIYERIGIYPEWNVKKIVKSTVPPTVNLLEYNQNGM